MVPVRVPGIREANFDRFVEVLAVDQAVADLFLGLCRPAAGNQDLAVANLDERRYGCLAASHPGPSMVKLSEPCEPAVGSSAAILRAC